MAVDVAIGYQERKRRAASFDIPPAIAIEAKNSDLRVCACANPSQAGDLRTDRTGRDLIEALIGFGVITTKIFVVRVGGVVCIWNGVKAGIVRLVGSICASDPETYFERRTWHRHFPPEQFSTHEQS